MRATLRVAKPSQPKAARESFPRYHKMKRPESRRPQALRSSTEVDAEIRVGSVLRPELKVLVALFGAVPESSGAPPSRHLRVAQPIALICCT